jgi:D-glycero-D-manno-heptose 1,7-bisphosphate phosphatase
LSRPAVFLDRDGTLNREVDYLADPEAFELLPGVGPALVRLAEARFALVVVTNQSGVARGLLDEETLARVHARMHADLAAFGVTLDGVEWCPHHPEFGSPGCDCRKPSPGMILRAARRLDLDLPASWVVGDALRDLRAGEAAGTRSVLVRTGKGRIEERDAPPGTRVVDDLPAAVNLVLER